MLEEHDNGWTERRMATQLPDVIAMLFADDVHRDPITKKCFVLGTYSSIAAPVFPWKQTALILHWHSPVERELSLSKYAL
jgi:hypothetical protein